MMNSLNEISESNPEFSHRHKYEYGDSNTTHRSSNFCFDGFTVGEGKGDLWIVRQFRMHSKARNENSGPGNWIELSCVRESIKALSQRFKINEDRGREIVSFLLMQGLISAVLSKK
jgi:hypothetical protein